MVELVREPIGPFLGVNLRRDKLNLADGDVLRAINLDFHTQPGAMRRRLGLRRYTTATYLTPITFVKSRALGGFYVAGGGELSIGVGTVLLTGLDDGLTTTASYQPLNDAVVYDFLANLGTNPLQKIAETTVTRWGIAAPTATPTLTVGAAGSLSGDYQAVYTYVRLDGTAVAHESNPSPTPTAVTLSSATLGIQVQASSDPQVNAIRVYRTVAGGVLPLFDQEVANADGTITSSQADTALGAAVEVGNDPPPVCASVAAFQQHLFLCHRPSQPNRLFYSKRFRPEAWPPEQFLEVGTPADPIQCALPLTGMLGVLTRQSKYRVFGNSTSGFHALEGLSTRGTLAPAGVLLSSLGVVFPARDGLWVTNFVEQDQELSQAIAPLFYGQRINEYAPIDWTKPTEISCAEYHRRLYFAYTDTDNHALVAVYSLDTQRWYHYEYPTRMRLYWQELPDVLLLVGQDGHAYQGELLTADDGAAIALDAWGSVGSDRFRLKSYRYLRADIDAGGESVAVAFYVDAVLKHTVTVTGTRTRQLFRLPAGCLGSHWHVQCTATGDTPVTLYALEVLGHPLEVA